MKIIVISSDNKQKEIILREICKIGRDTSNDIIISEPIVSSFHGEIKNMDGKIYYVDKSRNGSIVDGKRINNTEIQLNENSVIQIGSYKILLGKVKDDDKINELLRNIKTKIIDIQNIKKINLESFDDEQKSKYVDSMIREIMEEIKLPAGIDRKIIIKKLKDDLLGLGPIEDYLNDEEVTEIMVNGPDKIYIEKDGKIYLTESRFTDVESLKNVINKIVSTIGRRVDESQPYVDARLKDGSRVNVIIPPISLIGPVVTIRKFPKRRMTEKDLLSLGALSENMIKFLSIAVKYRKNILVSGGTGTGKTTFLNVLSSFIPPDERIITIEDSAELKLSQPHVIRLEARPPNIEGLGEVTIRELVKNSLRMRPDRIIVGEVRGGEALDMLQAMNTGHDGSLSTIHANSPRDALSRLATLVLFAGTELPERAIKEQIASAIDIIIHLSRFPDGSRKVTNITEICGLEGQTILTQDIFIFRQKGIDENKRVIGNFEATGIVPRFFEELKQKQIEVPYNLFQGG